MPRARLDLGRVVVVDFALRVEIDPPSPVLDRVGVLLKEADGVAVVGKGDGRLPFGRAVHLIAELGAPLLEVARLIVQDHALGQRHGVRCAAEAVRPVELDRGERATDGLAVHVREHPLLGEPADVLEEVDRLDRGRDRLEIAESDVCRAARRAGDDLAQRFVEPYQLVVVDVEEPVDAQLAALAQRLVHVVPLPVLQRPVVVAEVAVSTLLRDGHARAIGLAL
mmetsp:Transcript_15654/g.39846  ORF Transcript_15654/g.39846 Transcript_15654/m.39846 type:complete len:224 (+) Transcript_15654:235-906(+)